MKKLRLTNEIIYDNLCMGYGFPREIKEVTFTPIIYKVPYVRYQVIDGILTPFCGCMYQKRIIVRANLIYYLRFKGNAPIGKTFTLEEFKSKFYAINDSKGQYLTFKYYKK